MRVCFMCIGVRKEGCLCVPYHFNFLTFWLFFFYKTWYKIMPLQDIPTPWCTHLQVGSHSSVGDYNWKTKKRDTLLW
jgi:hypothetical protein